PIAISTLSLHDALPIFARLAAGLCDDAADQEIAFKLISGVLDGLSGDQECRHRTLVVADAFADQKVSFDPRLVVDVIGRIAMHQDRKSTRLNSSHVKIS